MGKVPSLSFSPGPSPGPNQTETSMIHHFSHPHPLQLSKYHQPQQTLNLELAWLLCSCCKLKVSDDSAGWIYTCLTCNYFLHVSCSKMPQQITHPIDQNHTLFLLIPEAAQGLFRCDACGKPGHGFLYHCGTCNIHLHPICSTMPLTLTHLSQSHHHHHLNLTFSPPYNNKIFSCDICKNIGSKEWLYRCNMCEFDAHLVCATSTTKARAPHHQVQQYQHQAPPPPTVVTSYYNNNNNNLQVPGAAYLHNGVQSYSFFNSPAAGPGVAAAGRSLPQNGLSNQQVLRSLVNATIPGLGLLMQGLSDGGGSTSGVAGDGSFSSFYADLNGMDFGATGMGGGSDVGGFGGF